MLTVAVCEDDAPLRSVLSRALTSASHTVVLARNGAEAVRDFPGREPDVVILDIGLPDSDGRDVCLALRAGGVRAPVLFLTALDGVHDKVAGFEAGADDYLTKPFEIAELLVRVAALGRRGIAAEPPADELRLDPARHALLVSEQSVALTPTEFRILARLMSAPGDVVRRGALVAAGWPMGAMVSDNTLDSYIRRLRAKVATVTDGHAIETARGIGYVWRVVL
jgi:two-component system OmpR family response regulator